MRLLIAGGGTGGHIYPALAVARSLRNRPNPPDLGWLGGHRGLEASLVPAADIELQRLVVRSLRTTDMNVHAALDPVRLGLSVPQAAALLARHRPAAIFTTGGYVAVPTMLAARPLGIPIVLWDGNVVPGRAVRATARLARAIAVSHEATGRALAGTGRPWYLTGTPIRDVRAIDRPAARAALDLPADARVVLVFGGSQAVRRLNAAVADALPRLVERGYVLHVAGDAGYPTALAGRERLPEELRDHYRPAPFLREEMLAALVAADLVVGRAGSSTLAEVTALGRPSIIVPYPHAAGHQDANARVLAAAGAARLIADEALDAATLLDAVAILDDEAARSAMATAARAMGRPGAADAVAALVMAAAERLPLPDRDVIERLSRGVAA